MGDEDSEQWLFEEAVELFEAGYDMDAKALFAQCLERHCAREIEVRTYLDRIQERADRLPFAEAVRLYNMGQMEMAFSRFQEVLDLGGTKMDKAMDYMERISSARSAAADLEGDRGDTRRGDATDMPEFPPFRDRREAEGNRGDTAPQEDIVRRTPHMDFTVMSPVKPGTAFTVSVYTDRYEPRLGEDSQDVVLEASSELTSFELQVRLLVTAHFTVDGSVVKPLVIDRDQDKSTVVEFPVTVKSEGALKALVEVEPAITATFSYNGRPSGKVSHFIVTSPPHSLAAGKVLAGDVIHLPSSDTVHVDAAATTADLTVTIIDTEENDHRHFWCTVQTPLLPRYAEGVTEEWNLSDTTDKIVNGFMANFTAKGATKRKRIAALRGAGIKLFEASPKIFQEVFWALVDTDKLPKTIAVISSEPYIPWELMIPHREIGAEAVRQKRDALGVECSVGRWTVKSSVSARQKLPITSSYAIAPSYTGNRKLPFAQEEAKFVIEKFSPGGMISPATFEGIDDTFQAEGRTLLHIACHGVTTDNGKQAIYLENNLTLDCDELLGLEGVEKGFRTQKPLVFMNACEVGRQVPDLIGIGGFAQSFIDMGASAVIAPLWSVKDSIAHEIAQVFYETVLAQPDMPFGQILQQMRAKAYDWTVGEDTYAAYCFYGDPLAARRTVLSSC